ncbi:MAG: DUF6438 domain-containing protein [Sphingomonas sp.]
MKRSIAAVAALALAGCATVRGGAPGEGPDAHMLTISYRTGPCFGACPVYSVRVGLDGTIVFNGIRDTAVVGERRIVDHRAAIAFFNRLQPLRPRAERLLTGPPGCAEMATDLPSVDVRWEGFGDPAHLAFYYGCDMEKNRALAEALGNAPDLLPIAKLIGARP